jgi:hypothetical protein
MWDQKLLFKDFFNCGEELFATVHQQAAAVFFRLKKIHKLLCGREFDQAIFNDYI